MEIRTLGDNPIKVFAVNFYSAYGAGWVEGPRFVKSWKSMLPDRIAHIAFEENLPTHIGKKKKKKNFPR